MIDPGQADHLLDVLALAEAILAVNGAATPDQWAASAASVHVILDNADTRACLMTAASLLAGTFCTLAEALSAADGREASGHLARIIAEGRRAAAA